MHIIPKNFYHSISLNSSQLTTIMQIPGRSDQNYNIKQGYLSSPLKMLNEILGER